MSHRKTEAEAEEVATVAAEESLAELPRQTSVEKAGTCEQCDGEVPAVETAYGSIIKGACPHCTKQDQLEAQKAAAEG